MNVSQVMVKVGFRSLSALAPKTAGKAAVRLFQYPGKRRLRPHETQLLTEARIRHFAHEGQFIPAYEMGPPHAPLVVLVHGWASWAGSLLGISRKLSQLGFRVLSFDLPAHGYSKQAFTNLLKMAQAIQSVLAELNPKEPFSVVAHSLGAAAVAHLLTGHYHQVDHLVYLATPDSFQSMFDKFAQSIGLNKAAHQAFEDEVSNRLRQPASKLSVSDFTASIRYRQLSVIHSKQDRVIPFRATEGFIPDLPHSSLYALEGVGHYGMLWSKEVLDLLEQILVNARLRVGSKLIS